MLKGGWHWHYKTHTEEKKTNKEQTANLKLSLPEQTLQSHFSRGTDVGIEMMVYYLAHHRSNE